MTALTPTIIGEPLGSSQWLHDARRACRRLDAVVALAIAALAVTERRRAWRGESCGCATCATGILE